MGNMKKTGFDHQTYIERQSHYILERVKGWDKLYLEFGGKLMQDTHAKRCLPGYRENAKLELRTERKGGNHYLRVCGRH